jgi:hypothetical protein
LGEDVFFAYLTNHSTSRFSSRLDFSGRNSNDSLEQ